jgi:hypothetical protein
MQGLIIVAIYIVGANEWETNGAVIPQSASARRAWHSFAASSPTSTAGTAVALSRFDPQNQLN